MKIQSAVKTMKAVFEDMDDDFRLCEYQKEIKRLLEAGMFVCHIDRHLEAHQQVICKICGRSVKQIIIDETGKDW